MDRPHADRPPGSPDSPPAGFAMLIGFMGAGKSTVGAELGVQLGWPFIDLDDLIAAEANMTIAEAFDRYGESHFRASESRHLNETLNLPRPMVLAVGGGIVESPDNRRMIAALAPGHVFYLEAPLTEMVRRCMEQARAADKPLSLRPVLADAEERFERRQDHYIALGHPVPTLGRSPQQIAASIVRLLQINSQPVAAPDATRDPATAHPEVKHER
jgi:shikimate kinase